MCPRLFGPISYMAIRAPVPRDESIFATRQAVQEVALDPVCHMTVCPDSPHRLEHQGRLYRFCAADCLEQFRAWPKRYLGMSERKG